MSLVSRVTDLAAAVRDKFNTMTPRLMPSGGAVGQVLTKNTSGNFDVSWQTSASGGAGLSHQAVRRLQSIAGM